MKYQVQSSTKKDSRGGARVGAGRPKGRKDYKTISIRIPEDIEQILASQENKSKFIIDAIRYYCQNL